MPNRCCVPQCGGDGGFKFPTDPDLAIKWRVAIKRLGPDKSLWKPGIHAVVCDKHFKAEDFKEPMRKSFPSNVIRDVRLVKRSARGEHRPLPSQSLHRMARSTDITDL